MEPLSVVLVHFKGPSYRFLTYEEASMRPKYVIVDIHDVGKLSRTRLIGSCVLTVDKPISGPKEDDELYDCPASWGYMHCHISARAFTYT